jgi:catechol 2,3-dioxygenase-like lactoylglutathione lyase family enzyme
MQRQSLPTPSDAGPLFAGHGQRVDAPDAPAAAPRFSHFVVEVTDLARSEAWYRDVIGLDVLGRDLTAEDRPHAVLQMNTGQLFILVQRPTVQPHRPGSAGVHHGFLLTPNQYRRAQERLEAHGYDVADTRQQFRARGEYSMDVLDPDGHRYQLQTYGPEAREIIRPGVGVVDCGPADRYKVGEVKAFKEGDFFLVRLREGFLALTRWCTHMNGRVVYQRAHWRFWCPFHGAIYDRRGAPIGDRPDVCPLRLNAISFSPDGHVLVDTDAVLERDCYAPDQAASPSGTGEY